MQTTFGRTELDVEKLKVWLSSYVISESEICMKTKSSSGFLIFSLFFNVAARAGVREQETEAESEWAAEVSDQRE